MNVVHHVAHELLPIIQWNKLEDKPRHLRQDLRSQPHLFSLLLLNKQELD